MKNRKVLYLSIIFGFLTLLSIRMDLLINNSDENAFLRYLDSLSGFSLEQIILLIGLIVIFFIMINTISIQLTLNRCGNQLLSRIKTDFFYAGVPGCCFALFMIIGNSIEKSGTITTLFRGGVQILKTITAFCGYTIFFTVSILYLFYIIERIKSGGGEYSGFKLHIRKVCEEI